VQFTVLFVDAAVGRITRILELIYIYMFEYPEEAEKYMLYGQTSHPLIGQTWREPRYFSLGSMSTYAKKVHARCEPYIHLSDSFGTRKHRVRNTAIDGDMCNADYTSHNTYRSQPSNWQRAVVIDSKTTSSRQIKAKNVVIKLIQMISQSIVSRSTMNDSAHAYQITDV
jgi:hypothetical protein